MNRRSLLKSLGIAIVGIPLLGKQIFASKSELMKPFASVCTNGTFTLHGDGVVTEPIPFNATNEEINAACNRAMNKSDKSITYFVPNKSKTGSV